MSEHQPATLSLRDAIAATDGRLDRPAASPELQSAAPAPAPSSRFVLLSIASTDYAMPEAFVTELERVPRITMVPRLPVWMRGVTNLRGDIVSVVDLRAFLGLPAYTSATARLLVVRLLDDPFTTGLIVDAVDRIVTLQAADITPPASPLEGALAPFLTGVCTVGDRLVAVLDIERLLRSPEIRQFEEPRSPEAALAATH
jgi:purine-binding chemotaxis protein CheW